jgi:hypothetical protein
MGINDRDLNHSAYRRMKEMLVQTYGRGRYIAIAAGEVVADAASFDELHRLVQQQGKNPCEVLIVQGGVEYPETAMIF